MKLTIDLEGLIEINERLRSVPLIPVTPGYFLQQFRIGQLLAIS
jgi:hypothetical protein